MHTFTPLQTLLHLYRKPQIKVAKSFMEILTLPHDVKFVKCKAGQVEPNMTICFIWGGGPDSGTQHDCMLYFFLGGGT